ncbi:MAG: inositol monophosphatase [Chloroflexi bacterium]|nr:inositol monophosphatase [Chloroflexota bacterium]
MVRSAAMSLTAASRGHLHLISIEETAAGIARRAGAILLERFRSGVVVEYKDERQRDPVTAVDRAVETLVHDELRRAFPDHGILGEEGAAHREDADLLWVLDPLDGTANFGGGLPFFGLSLALLDRGVPVIGCLFVPFGPHLTGGILRASLGNGATVDGGPLCVATGPFRPSGPVAVPPGLRAMFALEGSAGRQPGEARNLGSIVYELAMVAGGGFQYAVFGGPKLWDVAAGVLVIREAGGMALAWERGRWRRLERFRPMHARDPRRPAGLREWSQSILVGSPEAIRHIAPGLHRRPPPGPALRWAFARKRDARRWWKRFRDPPRGGDMTPTQPDQVRASKAGDSHPVDGAIGGTDTPRVEPLT